MHLRWRRLIETWRALERLESHAPSIRRALPRVFPGLLAGALLEGVGVGLLLPIMALLFDPNGAASGPVAWLRAALPGHTPNFYLAVVAAGVVAAIAAKNAIGFLTASGLARLQRNALVELRDALHARIHAAPLDTFDANRAGALASVFTQEAQRAVDAVSAAVLVVQLGLLGLVYVAGLLWLSPSLGAAAVVLGLLIGACVVTMFRRLGAAGGALTTANADLAADLHESFGGVRIVRVAGAGAQLGARFRDVNRRHADAVESYMRVHALLPGVVELLAVVGAMLLIAGAFRFLVLPGVLSAVTLSGFGLFLLRMIPLVSRFHAAQGAMQYLAAGVDAVIRWLAVRPFPARAWGSRTFTGVRTGIDIRGVTYRYESGTTALRDVTVRVPARSVVALVGHSGSGKTTLASLLLRLREPERGDVLVDGVPHRDFSEESWTRHVALVEQDVFLFHDTLRANVALGRADLTDADIRAALDDAHLTELVARLPHGLDTTVGERGAALSGGERQRLAIARALVRRPSLLVLDEATSNLDPITERTIHEVMTRAVPDRTVVVIAHRLATVRHADHIVVLDRGSVVEEGSWDALAGAGGPFARLVAAGTGGELATPLT